MLKIFTINALSDNYIYLLRNEQKNLTSVIDPGEAEPIIKFLNNKNWHLDEIINTHHHNDHIGGNNKLLGVYKSKLIAPSYEKNRISNVDVFVSDNEHLDIAGVTWTNKSYDTIPAGATGWGVKLLYDLINNYKK